MRERNVNLDILRLTAALMVVVTHIGQNFSTINPYTAFGARGVELFFILSGYLIFVSVEKSKNIKEFNLKRFIRIVPIYYIMLFIIFLWDSVTALTHGLNFKKIFFAEGICGIKFLRYFGFLQCVLPSKDWNNWNNRYALWTLSSFAFFYLIAPVLFRFIKKFAVSFFSLIVLLFLREPIAKFIETTLADYPLEGHMEWFSLMNPLNELYCFMFGVTLYFAIKERREILYAYILFLTIMVTQFQWYQFELFFTLFLILMITLPGVNFNAKLTRVFSAAAQGSFALYLCHPLIIKAVSFVFNHFMNGIADSFSFIIMLTVVIVLSYVFWYLIERPVEKVLNDKLLKQFM